MRRGRLDDEGQLANYWHTHAAGPGGPCSEIFVDRGAKYGPDGGPDVDEERFMEIWNLVFIQDQVDANLEIVGELPAKNIDTGSSLERVATLLQGEDNVFRDRCCSARCSRWSSRCAASATARTRTTTSRSR